MALLTGQLSGTPIPHGTNCRADGDANRNPDGEIVHRHAKLEGFSALRPRPFHQRLNQRRTHPLTAQRLRRSDIRGWIWHAGGRDVLGALAQRLTLEPKDLSHSAAALREYGNLSSAFVYFVLQAALAQPLPGGPWWVGSFGAGFSSHGALWEVE